MTRRNRVPELYVCDGILARSIGDNVRLARESLSWSLDHAADRVALTEPQLRHIEDGMRLPSLFAFLKLLAVYDLDADEVLGWRAANVFSVGETVVRPLGEVPRALGMEVQRARETFRVTLSHAAARLGITRAELGRIERGDMYPDVLLFARLVEEFDLCADALLRRLA